MNFLFLTRLPPFRPLRGGEFDYAVKLIEYLSKNSQIHAVAFANSQAQIKEFANVRWTLVPHTDPARWRSLFSGDPNVSFRNRSEEYLRSAVEGARKADVVFIDFIAMAWCVKAVVDVMRSWRRRPSVIFICHNHEAAVRMQMVAKERSPLRVALALDTYKARRLETEAITAADGIIAISSSDAEAFSRIAATPSVVITPGYDGIIREQRRIGPETPPRVTIMANYASQHKRMVVEQALKGLCRSRPALEYSLDVVGNGKSSQFTQLYPHVNFLGYVEDISAYLSGVRIGLVPDIIGGGFKTRVLMYAAFRVPILAIESAMRGMGFRPGIDYFSVESLAHMRDILPSLLADYITLNKLQDSAYQALSSYAWPTRASKIENFLSSLRLLTVAH